LAEKVGFQYSVDVLPITVAALMTPAWIARHLRTPVHATRILIPGYCQGDLAPLETAVSVPLEIGPRDLNQLARFFQADPPPRDYGKFDIEILAEINHCPQLSLAEIRRQAAQLAQAGADWIDVGCAPGDPWPGVYDTVRALCADGHRVSIDSFHPREAAEAIRAGAELVLSVNHTNRNAASDWGAEVVAIPDNPETLLGLDTTIEHLAGQGVPFRIDPILEPISFGFAASLGRYLAIRKRYPDAEMMMGIGNLTELTEVDSAGINTLLLGFCQELRIASVLTTQVIPWARTSVRECNVARRLMYHSIHHRVLPKHLDPRLVMLRDQQVGQLPAESMRQLAADIRDHNYRIHAARGEVHLLGRQLHLRSADPMRLMRQLQQRLAQDPSRKALTTEHAFYLGYEMCKASIALGLGKNYEQDEPLDWGMLTGPQEQHWYHPAGQDPSP
jgi:dihydropteroate synthase-like protein